MWHTLDLTEVVRKLRSNINYGITNEEAKIRLEKYGKNKIEGKKKESFFIKLCSAEGLKTLFRNKF